MAVNVFFELLQISLGNKDALNSVPSSDEWEDLYEEAEKQAVTGIMLAGLERLPDQQRPSQKFLLQWIGVGEMIRNQNRLLDKNCQKMLSLLKDYGIKGSILKGQGIALLYQPAKGEFDKGLRELRQSGDIDVYVDCGQKKAFEFAITVVPKVTNWDYKNLHLSLADDVEVEIHYRVEILMNLIKNRKLQKWFRENEALLFEENNEFTTPTTLFNVFYILLHIYRHFLYEGVGFRQIIDYYMVLRAVNCTKLDVGYSKEIVSKFGVERFAKGLMWVMRECLGMPCEWMLWEPDEKEGKYILKQVMQGGNFGHYDERLLHKRGKLGAVADILRHNMHLFLHYPADVLWAPVWIVWHKLWKVCVGNKLTVKAYDYRYRTA